MKQSYIGIIAFCVLFFSSCADGEQGKYVLDKDDLMAAMIDAANEESGGLMDLLPEDKRREMTAMIEETVASMSVTLELKDDSQFEFTFKTGEDDESMTGTYTVDGSVLRLTNGVHKSGPEAGPFGGDFVAKIEGDSIVVTMKDPEMPFEFVLKR